MENFDKKIIDKIENDKIRMKNKAYFIFRSVVLVLAIIFISIISLFFASLIIFTLRASGLLLLPPLGFRGLKMFFFSFPWVMAIFILLLMFFLSILAKKYKFVYKKPLLYSVLGIVIIVLIGGFVFARFSFHDKIFERRERSPIISLFYKGKEIKDLYIGQVIEIGNNRFVLQTKEGNKLTIISKIIVEIDDPVVVIGKREGDIINAFNVRKINNDHSLFPQRRIEKPNLKPINYIHKLYVFKNI